MKYKVVRTNKAEEQLRLQGIKDGYRLRVGNLRILFSMEDDNIYIDNIIPRGQAYKRL